MDPISYAFLCGFGMATLYWWHGVDLPFLASVIAGIAGAVSGTVAAMAVETKRFSYLGPDYATQVPLGDYAVAPFAALLAIMVWDKLLR